MRQSVFIYMMFYGGIKVRYDLGCNLEAILDLGNNSSKFSQTMMKDVTIDTVDNIQFLSVISLLRELKLYLTRS